MKLTVAKKMSLGFGLILALMILTATLAYFRATSVDEVRKKTASVNAPSVSAIKDLKGDLNQSLNKTRQTVLGGSDRERYDEGKVAFEKIWQAIDKDVSTLTELAPRWTLQGNRERLASIKGELPRLRMDQEQAMRVASSGEKDAVKKAGDLVADKAMIRNDAIGKVLVEMAESVGSSVNEGRATLQSDVRSIIWTPWASTLVALLIAITVVIYMSRSISKATQSIIVSISDNARQVATASEGFFATSQQLTANSEDTSAQANVVSAATEEINRNLQTVATSTEEMSASINEIASNASEAAKVAAAASKAAVETNAIVTKLGERGRPASSALNSAGGTKG
jgi:methyl-accepting chemotaxis protein